MKISPFRGEQVFFFEVVDGRAREISQRDFFVKRRGQLQVWLQLASVNGRMRCVGVDIRGYQQTDTEPGGIKPFPHRVDFAEISSSIWRSIPIGDLIQRAITGRKADYRVLAGKARAGALDNRGIDLEEVARRYESLIGDEPDRPRRGPKRLLTLDDLTTVVRPAYLSGGRTPVVAVRDALSGHRGQPVTMDQARKAVVQAREVGALPPASGRGKP
jgi:hypothetical protein